MFIVEPYLLFNGNCEEAFNFYKSVFGGEFTGIMKYKDIPDKSMEIPEKFKNNVMHVALPIGKYILLMGSDAGPGAENIKTGDNIVLTLSIDNEEEAKRLFNKLSEGGKIRMPLQKTFWADLYAMFTDKFGINWNINYGYERKS